MATGDKKRALMADDLNNAGSDYPVMPLKTVDSSPDASHTNNLITSAAVAAALANKADKTGLTDIFTTGSTNNSGGAIGAGVFFYKDGTLVQAKTAIASGATLTLNTNYEVPTAGALNELKAAIPLKTGIVNWSTIVTGGTLSVKQFGNIVVINGYIVATLTANTVNSIGTISGVGLPVDAIRAIAAVAVHAYDPASSIAYLNITTSGAVTITPTVGGSQAVYFSTSYFTTSL